MNRRNFLKASIIGGATVALTGSYLLVDGKVPEQLTVDVAVKRLDKLTEQVLTAPPSSGHSLIKYTGVWSPYQIFIHCAQSIEYSMLGFPEHKSSLFKGTIGKAAFSVFEHKGRMTHGLSDVIPSAEPIAAEGDVLIALARLKTAFKQFKAYKKRLQPHFAYGQLSKREYEIAHVMHLNNHLEEILHIED